MFEAIAFYLFAGLTTAMFLIVVMSKNALYSMSAMAAGMIFISGFFFLLNADFLGVVQIIVYSGAVVALYAFGMMFVDTTKDVEEKVENPKMVFLLSGAVALLLVLMVSFPLIGENVTALHPMGESNPKDVGVVLFTKYLVPFELAAVMLLVAMIAGIILAGKKMDRSLTLLTDEEIENEEFAKGDKK